MCDHHNLFYSDREVTEADLPTGFKFKCEHADNEHFGLRSKNGRDWHQMTWDLKPYNIECQGSNGPSQGPQSLMISSRSLMSTHWSPLMSPVTFTNTSLQTGSP